jgi:hypothetical protein
MKKRTDEELAQIVTEYIEKCHSPVTRNKIKIATGINNTRLDELEELGLVKLPAKVYPGSNSRTWRWYKT